MPDTTETRDVLAEARSKVGLVDQAFQAMAAEIDRLSRELLEAKEALRHLNNDVVPVEAVLRDVAQFFGGWPLDAGEAGAEIQAEADRLLSDVNAALAYSPIFRSVPLP